jgi:hypothetical protein
MTLSTISIQVINENDSIFSTLIGSNRLTDQRFFFFSFLRGAKFLQMSAQAVSSFPISLYLYTFYVLAGYSFGCRYCLYFGAVCVRDVFARFLIFSWSARATPHSLIP